MRRFVSFEPKDMVLVSIRPSPISRLTRGDLTIAYSAQSPTGGFTTASRLQNIKKVTKELLNAHLIPSRLGPFYKGRARAINIWCAKACV
jgi:hypothetical protein